jgi:hypothetical protein
VQIGLEESLPIFANCQVFARKSFRKLGAKKGGSKFPDHSIPVPFQGGDILLAFHGSSSPAKLGANIFPRTALRKHVFRKHCDENTPDHALFAKT